MLLFCTITPDVQLHESVWIADYEQIRAKETIEGSVFFFFFFKFILHSVYPEEKCEMWRWKERNNFMPFKKKYYQYELHHVKCSVSSVLQDKCFSQYQSEVSVVCLPRRGFKQRRNAVCFWSEILFSALQMHYRPPVSNLSVAALVVVDEG